MAIYATNYPYYFRFAANYPHHLAKRGLQRPEGRRWKPSGRKRVTSVTMSAAAAEPPANVADPCHRLVDIEGTGLPGLIGKLSPDPAPDGDANEG